MEWAVLWGFTGIVCCSSLVLLLRDRKICEGLEDSKPQIEALGWIYCVLAVCLIFWKTYSIGTWELSLQSYEYWKNIRALLLMGIIWPIAWIDLKTWRIPNSFIVLGLIVRLVIFFCELIAGEYKIWFGALTDLIAVVALLLAAVLCNLVIKKSVGYGDMKMFVIMSLLLGLDRIWEAIFYALILSFFIAIFLLATKKKSRKDRIPFGPALVIGTFLSVLIYRM